ncbi:MAG TPA: ATP-binding cassette domain-containing protein, partial [Acidimicrobiales bacterium]|nr:ATP-binding cassette domain-containing protein [Acidimicrobiales bacterium]
MRGRSFMSAPTGQATDADVVPADGAVSGPAGAPPAGVRYDGRSLTKSFDGATVLSQVSVVFEPGEIHAVVGENGAGKSTLVKIMAGIYQPDSGELLLGDDRLTGLSPRSAQHRGIYLVPQEPALMQSLS